LRRVAGREDLGQLASRWLLGAASHRTAVAAACGLSDRELLALAWLDVQPMRPRDLRLYLGLTSGGTTMLCQRLQRRGDIARRAVDGDARGIQLVLTDQGAGVVRALLRHEHAALEAAARSLSAAQLHAVGVWLAALTPERGVEAVAP
jgi:DNA-binding MarR family transcriptional regulator